MNRMNKEIIQALRTENEALRMLIDSIGKRLALQQEQLDLLLRTCESESHQPAAPLAEEAEKEVEVEAEPQPTHLIEQEPEPIADEPKPIIEESKPIEEEVKPIAEEAKPVSAAPTPAAEEAKPAVSHKETPAEPAVAKPQPNSLNDLLERQPLSDFRKAFSLNDRFRFRRELFSGSETLMNQVIADLNEIKSYEESIAYINKVLHGSVEEEAMADFLQLIEKRFA